MLRWAIAGLPGLLALLPMLAQDAPPTDWVTFVIREGVAVGVLIFILMRIEPRLKALEVSNDRQARAAFLLLMDHPNLVVRERAKSEIQDIDSKTPRQ